MESPAPIKMNHGRSKIRDFHKDLDGERIGNMGNGVSAGNTLQYISAIKFPVYTIVEFSTENYYQRLLVTRSV